MGADYAFVSDLFHIGRLLLAASTSAGPPALPEVRIAKMDV